MSCVCVSPAPPGPYRQVNTAVSKQGKFYGPRRTGGSAAGPGDRRREEPGASPLLPVPTAPVPSISASLPQPLSRPAAAVVAPGMGHPPQLRVTRVGCPHGGSGCPVPERGGQSEKKAQMRLCSAGVRLGQGCPLPFPQPPWSGPPGAGERLMGDEWLQQCGQGQTEGWTEGRAHPLPQHKS